MKIFTILFTLTICFIIKSNSQTVSDFDGNVYNTISIGSQVWIKENLKVTHYRNGDVIANVTDNSTWGNSTTGAFCYYDNNSSNSAVYGNLYNYYAVIDNRNLCPADWHVPAEYEWNNLINELGGSAEAGGKMKELGLTHWNSPNTGATNSSSFTAVPGGIRQGSGTFSNIGKTCFLWSTTDLDTYNSLYKYLSNSSEESFSSQGSNSSGLSVRCISNYPSSVNDLKNENKIKIYPNPASENITIDSKNNEFSTASIYNIIGKCILSQKLNKNNTKINIKSIQSGVYIIILSNELGKSIQQKLIIE